MNKRSKRKGSSTASRPTEIPMTDLGWTENNEDGDDARQDIHAAGTPGGGTASGGLAGSNKGARDPDGVDFESALGSGVFDTSGDDEGRPPYAGESGGAVGGVPAEKRAKGGHHHGGLSPGGSHRGDSTIGSPVSKTRKK
jgi:hypothetical protein